MRRGATAGLVGPLAALALAGCGTATAPQVANFEVRGVGVLIQTDAAFARQADLPGRVESTVTAALHYWNGSWDALRGATIVLDGAAHVACTGADAAIGCYDGDIRVSTLDAGASVRCLEQTVLVHEVGHAVIGDAAHQDPRWMDFGALERVLAGRPGYTAAGVADCPLSPSAWRHPPHR